MLSFPQRPAPRTVREIMIHSILLLIGIAVFVTGIVIAFGGNPISHFPRIFPHTRREGKEERAESRTDRKQSLVFLTIGGALILFGLAGVMKTRVTIRILHSLL